MENEVKSIILAFLIILAGYLILGFIMMLLAATITFIDGLLF